MADKRIQDLTPASQVQTSDRFVLEQSGQAKSLTGQILINDLAAYLDGHGGINDISYTPPLSGELNGTLTVTLADETVETFTVTNGRGISSIGYVESIGLDDYYEISYNDDSEPTTFIVHNGEKGDTGDNWYVHIKWSANEPTQDSDMSDTPDNWIGIYSGVGETAPTSYSEYTWFEYKGETGDTGNGIESISLYSSSGIVDTYRVLFTNGSSTTFEVTNGSNISNIAKTSSAGLTDTYTVTLTNGDTTNFTVSNAKSITSITPPGNPGLPGQTDRYIINFNNGDATFFDVYNGTNGTGSVSLVDNIAPIGGSVPLLTFGSGAPTVDTPGSVKSRYFDTLNNQLYICVAVDEESTPSTYTWRGSSVTVDNYLSTTSTNPVQNAVLTALLGTAPLDTTAQTLTEAVNEILDDISGFADNLAAEYDPTATYEVGDLCLYDNTLYRCNTAISTPEAWNSIHWTQTSVDAEQDTISNDLDSLGSTVSGISSTIGNTALPTTAQTLTGAIAEIDGDVSGKVSKTGDSMSGGLRVATGGIVSDDALVIQDLDYSLSDLPTSSIQKYLVTFKDKATNILGFLRGYINASGNTGITIAGRNVVNGSVITNVLNLFVDADGTRRITVSDDAPWRKMLGLGNADGALPITIAQGGTGQTGVSRTSTVSQIATAASGFTIDSATMVIWGKIAQFDIKVSSDSALQSGSHHICTLVSGKRPAITTMGMTSSGTRVYVGTNGNIAVYDSFAAGVPYYIRAKYILN